VEKVLAPMYRRDRDFFHRPEVVFTQELAHAGSKFVFLREDGKVCIWNEEEGVKAGDGHWYSNNSYLSARNWASARPVALVTTSHSRLDEDEAAYQRYLADKQDESDSPSYEEDYTMSLIEELERFGFTLETLREVEEMLGLSGLEALHDLI
jgi:hypothetical protein